MNPELKCDACRKVRTLCPVTIGFSLSFDGAWRMRAYLYLCAECHRSIDTFDEMIGPTMAESLCRMIRASRKNK